MFFLILFIVFQLNDYHKYNRRFLPRNLVCVIAPTELHASVLKEDYLHWDYCIKKKWPQYYMMDPVSCSPASSLVTCEAHIHHTQVFCDADNTISLLLLFLLPLLLLPSPLQAWCTPVKVASKGGRRALLTGRRGSSVGGDDGGETTANLSWNFI